MYVDISIWIHQVIKGFQDSRGGTVPNAHLLGLFNRLCKLLYYRVKPVFVFDGGVPNLKIQTIAKRNQLKNKYVNESERIQQQILNTLVKHKAVQHLLKGQVKKVSPKKVSPEKATTGQDDDMFKLPPMAEEDLDDFQSDSSDTSLENKSWTDLHTVDVESKEFKSLPLETQYDILQDLKESRKQSSWGRIHELPEQSDDFSSFQMKRLRKRRAVQVTLDEVEKEMGGHSLSITDLERILTDEGILAAEGSQVSKRIASDENKRYLYIKDLKEAMAQAMKNKDAEEHSPSKLPRIEEISEDENETLLNKNIETLEKMLATVKDNKTGALVDYQLPSTSTGKSEVHDESLGMEFDEDLQAAIKLSLQAEEDPLCSESFLDNFNETLEESRSEIPDSMALARAYMMENSDLTQEEIHKIIRENNKKAKKGSHKINLKHILKNLPASKSQEEVELKYLKQENIFPKRVTEIKSDVLVEISSDSDDDFIEVMPNTIIKSNTPKIETTKDKNELISSDSDSDFIEATPKIETNAIEIVINKDNVINDDIFDDVFSNINSVKDESSKLILNNLLTGVQNKNIKLEDGNNKQDVIENRLEVDVKTPSEHENKLIEIKSANTQDERWSINENQIKESISTDDIKCDTIEIETSLDNSKISNNDSIISINDSQVDVVSVETPEEKTKLSVDDKKIPVIQLETPVDDIKNSNDNNEIPMDFNKPSIDDSKILNGDVVTKLLLDDSKTSDANETQNETQNLPTNDNITPSLSTKDLEIMSDQLEKETNALIIEKSKQDRMGNTISEQMTRDIQDLLQLFGIPYIVAPMEAEAQCAFLNEIKLTDGTITDDSDIWLFGGKTVYKNFFDQKKYVMEFRSENIYNHFKLSREQLIQFAMLVGSDYTTGIQNVGPVTALEILAAFPSQDNILSGLTNFKIWFQNGPKAAPGKTALISKLKKVILSEGFPSIHVVRAYMDPTVETSKEPFRWGQPDLTILREYTRTKFGWTTAKTDDILKPVIAKMNIKQSQKSIKDFFHIRDLKIGSVDKLSKRVQLAVDKLSGRLPDSDDESKEQAETKKPKRQRKNKQSKAETKEPKLKQIQEDIKKPLSTKSVTIAKKLHAKEIIPQKEKDKAELLKNKMKAVEIFRKSKKGPGYVKSQKLRKQEPLEDANLSESSDN